MGCISSRLRAEDVVGRCKARKRLMKQAVGQRHAFAAAHAAYIVALRNTGSALKQFAEEEGGLPASGQGIPEPLPPPPLPALYDSPPHPPLKPWDFAINEPFDSRPAAHPHPASDHHEHTVTTLKVEEEHSPPTSTDVNHDEADDDQYTQSVPVRVNDSLAIVDVLMDTPEMPDNNNDDPIHNPTSTSPEQAAGAVHDGNFARELSLMLRLNLKKDLAQIVREIDEEFLKASAGGADVARMLETCDPRAVHSDLLKAKSTRVFSAFSWNWSRSPLYTIGNRGPPDKYPDAAEHKASHALTLERLLAWEKKLFEEVKVVEAVRTEQGKKCSILRRQEMKGEVAADIEKTRAEIKRLHSLILVCNHGIDSTVEAIEDLRDDELHPQLVEMISGLMNMWGTMHRSHARQTQIIIHIKNIDAMMSQEPTSESHHQATMQLEKELLAWHESFCKLVASQRGYMAALYGWIKLSIIPIPTGKLDKKRQALDDNDEDQEIEDVETYRLCEEWHRALGCLPDRVASEAIKSLTEVVKAMVSKQGEEMKQKRKANKLEKQWEKKVRALQPLEEDEAAAQEEARKRRRRRSWRRSEEEEEEEEEVVGRSVVDHILAGAVMERKAAVAAMRKKVEEEMVKHCKAVQDTRVLTMNNLQTGLPGVLEAMTGFSAVCYQAFQHLYTLTACPHF